MGRVFDRVKIARGLASPLVLAVIVLATVGLSNLWGMSIPSFVDALFSQQLLWLGLSVAAAIVVVIVDPRFVERYGYWLFAIGVTALGAVLVFGESIHGARRWLNFVAIHVQPSELIKLLLVIAFAKYSASNPRGGEPQNLHQMLVPAAMTCVPIVLILLQPDLSSALIVALIAFTLVVVAGLKLTSLAKVAGLALIVLPFVWFFALRSYQKARILAFLEPSDDPLGSDWQSNQSVIAIGSGGWTGRGLSQSTQISFVPCHHDDLPFSIFCEEQGFLGSFIVLGLYLLVWLWCLRTSRASRGRFGAMVAAGVGVMIFWQVVANIGVAVGVMPSTGVALPFFSTGGSALFTTMLGLGLVVSIDFRNDRAAREEVSRHSSRDSRDSSPES